MGLLCALNVLSFHAQVSLFSSQQLDSVLGEITGPNSLLTLTFQKQNILNLYKLFFNANFYHF